LRRGLNWLLSAQNEDGGWGGAPAGPSSTEETALALDALAGAVAGGADVPVEAIDRACTWLIKHTDGGTSFDPAPIGLYFARLWYHERLYPLIFTAAALARIRRLHPASDGPSARGGSLGSVTGGAPGTRSRPTAHEEV
jgi:squalene-hopene/tetraprenyl-beta-curcumene cyclase